MACGGRAVVERRGHDRRPDCVNRPCGAREAARQIPTRAFSRPPGRGPGEANQRSGRRGLHQVRPARNVPVRVIGVVHEGVLEAPLDELALAGRPPAVCATASGRVRQMCTPYTEWRIDGCPTLPRRSIGLDWPVQLPRLPDVVTEGARPQQIAIDPNVAVHVSNPSASVWAMRATPRRWTVWVPSFSLGVSGFPEARICSMLSNSLSARANAQASTTCSRRASFWISPSSR